MAKYCTAGKKLSCHYKIMDNYCKADKFCTLQTDVMPTDGADADKDTAATHHDVRINMCGAYKIGCAAFDGGICTGTECKHIRPFMIDADKLETARREMANIISMLKPIRAEKGER